MWQRSRKTTWLARKRVRKCFSVLAGTTPVSFSHIFYGGKFIQNTIVMLLNSFLTHSHSFNSRKSLVSTHDFKKGKRCWVSEAFCAMCNKNSTDSVGTPLTVLCFRHARSRWNINNKNSSVCFDAQPKRPPDSKGEVDTVNTRRLLSAWPFCPSKAKAFMKINWKEAFPRTKIKLAAFWWQDRLYPIFMY